MFSLFMFIYINLMKKHHSLVLLFLCGVSLMLPACGIRQAPSFPDKHWKPIHKYSDSVNKIPLRVTRVYAAQAADKTLRTLLQRWASESGTQFVYGAGHDFSLPKDVASIKTTSLVRAVAQLGGVYRTHGVEIFLDVTDNVLHVKETPLKKQKNSTPF